MSPFCALFRHSSLLVKIKSMGASAISKDHQCPGRSTHVKITILRPASPRRFSESAKLAEVLKIPSLPTPSIAEDAKGESDSIEASTVENIRHHGRRKKIVWQPTTPDPDSKVHYVNIEKAPPISPSSSSGAKSAHMTPSPSTTPSPVEPSLGSFSDASKRRISSKSMHDFTNILDNEKLPLTYQQRNSAQKAPLQHASTHYRLTVPRQTLPAGRVSPEKSWQRSEDGSCPIFTATTRKDAEEGGNATKRVVDLSSRLSHQFKRSTL